MLCDNLEEIKKSQSIMHNAITEIKIPLGGINTRIIEAEDRISEMEDRMVKINIIKTFLVFKSIKGFFPLILSCSFSLSLEICVNTVERGFNFFIINNIYIYGDISLVLTLNK